MNILQRAIARMIFGPPPIKANSDPPGTWVDYLTGRTTSAPMSETKALNLSGVFCAVTIIANAMKCLPLFTYERLPGHGKRPAVNHPNYRLLHDSPHPNYSPSRFQRLLTFWAVLWGNGRAEIQRSRDGSRTVLNPIHPSRAKTETRADGSVWHLIRNDDGTWSELPDRDVLHIQGLSEDGVNGISLIGIARRSLGLTVSAEEYGTRFFDNNARPSVVLKHPGKLDEEAEKFLKRSWGTAFGGRGQHGTAVLEENMDVVTLGMPNEDAQFLETRGFQIIELARWFNVPPHKLKDLIRATFSNIVEQSLEFVGETILPWAKEWEQEVDRKLFTEEERERFFAEFLLDALLRADPKSRNEAFEIQRRNGILNADGWRARENMNPIGGPVGEMYIVESNMTNAKTLAAGIDPERRGTDRRQTSAVVADSRASTVMDDGDNATIAARIEAVALAHVPVIADTLYRMRKIEVNAARRAAKRGENIVAWSESYFNGHVPKLRLAMVPCIESLAIAIRAAVDRDWTDEEWDEHVGRFTKGGVAGDIVAAKDMVQLANSISDEDIRKRCEFGAGQYARIFVQRTIGEST